MNAQPDLSTAMVSVAQDIWSPDGVSLRDLAPLVYLPRKPHPALTPWVDHYAVLQVPSLPCGRHHFNFYPDAGVTLLFHFDAGEPAGIELRFSDGRYQQAYRPPGCISYCRPNEHVC